MGSSLSLKFHEVATSMKKSKKSCFLKVTEVCLGIEEMMGSILDSDYSEALQKLNLDLILTDYTTIVLSVCPLLYNVLFKIPAVFVDRLSGFFFKSSFLIRWNITSGVFEVIKREEIKKTSERQLNVNAEVKPLFQTNWRGESLFSGRINLNKEPSGRLCPSNKKLSTYWLLLVISNGFNLKKLSTFF